MTDKTRLLRELPSVDELIRSDRLREASIAYPQEIVVDAARSAIEGARAAILSGGSPSVSADALSGLVAARLGALMAPSIVRVVNATGTILHTNLGRAVLGRAAAEAVTLAATSFTNLELDPTTGERGERDSRVEGLIKTLTTAEAACVVNNNAAAVLLTLNTLAEGGKVAVSRGELIEIGGSFRLPEVIRKSGCVLMEVGTTNRTHPKDYAGAIDDGACLVFKAHTSNYRVVGFTSAVGLGELAGLSHPRGVPVVEDLGSGSLADLSAYGLPGEPLVSESIAHGADIVTFSGDKLLGGPQAGIIAGRAALVERIRKNPLKRALRVDKLTLAGLEATLRLYLAPRTLPETLPVLKYISRPLPEIERIAKEAASLLRAALGSSFCVEVVDGESVVGGGCLPGRTLPTRAVSIAHAEKGPDEIFRLFAGSSPPVLGRVHKDRFLLDLRTVEDPADVVPSRTALQNV